MILCHCNLFSYGFLCPLLKGVHVLGQKEVVHQALSNMTPSPFSHTRTLALARKGLPSSWNVGCHASAAREEDAGSFQPEPMVLGWWHLLMAGGDSCLGISLIVRDLLGDMLPFSGSTWWRWRRERSRGHLTTTLGWLLLRDLPSARHKTINCHGLSGHHVFITIGFGFRVNKFYS